MLFLRQRWLKPVLLVALLALLLLPLATPAQAGTVSAQLTAVCVDGTVEITWDATGAGPFGATYFVTVNGNTVATGESGSTSVPGTGLMVVGLYANYEGEILLAQETVTCVGEADAAACQFADGRVNATECAPPVVPFCLPYGIYVYAIDPETGEGSLLMMVRDEVLAAIGVPEENTPLAQANGVILSRLSTGEYQINALDFEGKPYILVWDDCPPGEVYLIK